MDPERAHAPTPGQVLRRGLTKRCPVCGSGHLFHGWFRMKACCPRCGYRFEREEGFFLGAYTINLVITEGLLLVLAIVPLILLLATQPDVSIWPFLGMGLMAAIIAPILFYPFSRTIWSAIDLLLRPAERPPVGPRAAP